MHIETIIKYLNNSLTRREKKEFIRWVNESEKNKALFIRLKNAWERSIANDAQATEKDLKQKYSELCRKLELTTSPVSPPEKRHILVRALPYAAAITLLLALGILLWHQSVPDETQMALAPGSNKAILTLADGSRIILDSVQSGNIAQQGNTKIIKLDNGRLVYSDSVSGMGKHVQANHPVPVYKGKNEQMNTLATPRGGQHQLKLPDGSRVWVNAASRITFPITFEGKERRVKISGEAYFEIAPNNAMPFIVNVNDKAEVKVLGTHFNINAYDDENSIKTTLVEGSVQVFLPAGRAGSSLHPSGQEVQSLAPGQQASIDRQGKIAISEVDVREHTLWKDGWFYFNNQKLEMILNKLSRWYDFTFRIEDPELKDKIFSIKVKRFEEFETVISILEKTELVDFQVDGKTIVVFRP